MSRLLALLVLLAVPLAPTPVQAAASFYDNAAILLPKVRSDRKDTYRRSVVAALARGRIKSVAVARNQSGTKKEVIARRGSGTGSLKSLSLAGVAAVAYTAHPKFRGSELDMLVRLRKGGMVPVTVWHSKGGDVVVSVGRKRDGRPRFGGDRSDSASEIRRRYGTGRIKGSGTKWKDRELLVLDGALGKLSAAERRVLDDVAIVRSPSGVGGPKAAGHYFWGTEGYRLVIYNRAFSFDSRAFIGPAEGPRPFSSMTVLHEVGHAIAAWPARRKLEKGDPRGAARLAKRTAVLQGYSRRRGSKRGPTRYGRTSLAESFAEAFALYKLDPAGLKRWSRDVYDWFKADGHVKAMKK